MSLTVTKRDMSPIITSKSSTAFIMRISRQKFPSSSLNWDSTFLPISVLRICNASFSAKIATTTVWVDMEASNYVDATLDIYRRALKIYPNVGICLQAYLYRTKKDLADLLPLRPSIRLVKGAYKEPDAIAFPKKADVDENYFTLAQGHAHRPLGGELSARGIWHSRRAAHPPNQRFCRGRRVSPSTTSRCKCSTAFSAPNRNASRSKVAAPLSSSLMEPTGIPGLSAGSRSAPRTSGSCSEMFLLLRVSKGR